jgi:hypothetical protein
MVGVKSFASSARILGKSNVNTPAPVGSQSRIRCANARWRPRAGPADLISNYF